MAIKRNPMGGARLPDRLRKVGVAALLFLSVTAAFAQGVFDRPVRIGLVLPVEAVEEPEAGERPASAAQAALLGALFAKEELVHNASLLGIDVDVIVAGAADGEVAAAARRLVEEEGAFGIAGGFGAGRAADLSRVAEELAVPFLNIGWPGDELRNEQCGTYTFHVEPSDAMYIDAITGWFVRAGFRRWAFVHTDDERGRALYERARWALQERHFGGREVARVRVPEGAEDWDRTITSLRRARPEVVLVLLDPQSQLELQRAAAQEGEEWALAGFPYPDTQTRAFYAALVEAAGEDSALYRGAEWEATLDAYGAREFNARFEERWGTPMDPGAWAAYQAVKILYDAALATRSLAGPDIAGYFAQPQAVFDIWKGIGVTFRPWDHQLRQSLYLVQIGAGAEGALATLVGELPALYLPRTDPVERLDQLGDLSDRTRCRPG